MSDKKLTRDYLDGYDAAMRDLDVKGDTLKEAFLDGYSTAVRRYAIDLEEANACCCNKDLRELQS